MENEEIERLKLICKEIRNDVLDEVYNAQSGHMGGSLSVVEILVVLYHKIMNLKENKRGDRIDKLVLSKGHAAPALYAILASKGYIAKEELKNLRNINSILEGHQSNKINGVDVSASSLGQGLSVANGMGIAKKLNREAGYIYCILGDGECEEGQIWEAFMTMHKYNLYNVIPIIDYNKYQLDGSIDKVKKIGSYEDKIKGFGINVINIDGNNVEEIAIAIESAKACKTPTCIIANTVKGKGISFMENTSKWHGKAPNEEEYLKAKAELK